MSDWGVLLYIVGAGLMLWMTMRTVKRMPEAFTKESFFKTSHTLAVLALLLIVFVGFYVIFVL